MLRFALFAILFVAICTASFDDESESSGVEVFIGGSIEKYLAHNPEVELVQQLEETELQSHDGITSSVFAWGNRAAGK